MTGPSDLARDVAVCTRLLVRHGIVDSSGHVSARIPDTDWFFIQRREQGRATLEVGDLLVVDMDGVVVEGSGLPPAEVAIHARVYRNRPDVGAVCHGHPGDSVVFSVVDRPLVPVRHFAFEFPDGVPVHDDPTHITTADQGDAVARTLGDGGACLLRSHGTVVVASSIAELFMDCLDLEENARTLLRASSLGEVAPLSRDEIDAVAASYRRNDFRAAKTWEHHVALGRMTGVL